MKPIGKIIVLLLVLGLAFGGWRLYKASGGSGMSGMGNLLPGGGPVTLELVTSATKKGWLEAQVDRFNAENKGKVTVKLTFRETRQAMQEVLNGKLQPNLWSPSSPVWAVRLEEVWTERHSGEQLLNMADPNTYRTYLRTPLVFLTSKQNAPALTPLLSGPNVWQNLRDLGDGKKRIPGIPTFRFAHADPIAANSGFLTVGMMLTAYQQTSAPNLSLDKAATSAGFKQFMGEVDRNLTVTEAITGGSSALLKDFLRDTTRYQAITAYESSALEAAQERGDIRVIYPNPTVVAEQSVVVFTGKWVAPAQREAAAKLLTFLASEESIKEGVASHFRPTASTSTLAPELTKFSEQGFKETFTAGELPSYKAMNDAACVWHTRFTGKGCQ